MTRREPSTCVGGSGLVSAGGFTLIESVMSILIVGLMLVAALNTVGASKLSQMRNAEQVIGPPLAEDLMAEILNQLYEEPDDSVDFGRESGESGGDRADWDDVDDYDGHSSSPPEAKDGSALPGLTGWARKVTVNWADPLIPANNALLPSGIKRIKVEVLYQGRVVTTMTALRTNAWPDTDEPPIIPPKVLMVVVDTSLLTQPEIDRKALLESLGCVVTLINNLADKQDIEDAMELNDVAYIPAHITVDKGGVMEKTTKGVVSESKSFLPILGFSANSKGQNATTIVVMNSSHYITTPFSIGLLSISTTNGNMTTLNGSDAPGMDVLALVGLNEGLAVLETGATRHDSVGSPGRLVKLPWGNAGIDINILKPSGKTLMQRSIEWAANLERPD